MYVNIILKATYTIECKSTIYFLIHLLIMLLQLSHFHPFTQLHPAHPLPPTFPPYSSCPWVILISSLASTFPILFLPSPYFQPTIYATYPLYLFPLSASHSPDDNPPCDLHFCGSIPVLVVCLVCFCFCFLGSVVDSCEFVVISLFINLIFFFLHKSL